MVEKIPETRLNPPWKELFKIASTWEYDSFHSHKEMESIMGVNRKHQQMLYAESIEMLRSEMSAIGKRLKNVKGEGYKVLNPADQLKEVGVADHGKMVRKGRLLLTHLNNVPEAPLANSDIRKKESLIVSESRTLAHMVNGYMLNLQILGIDRNQKMLAKAANKKQE